MVELEFAVEVEKKYLPWGSTSGGVLLVFCGGGFDLSNEGFSTFPEGFICAFWSRIRSVVVSMIDAFVETIAATGAVRVTTGSEGFPGFFFDGWSGSSEFSVTTKLPIIIRFC